MAPFLNAAVLHSGINEPLELILAIIHAAEEFERENKILDEDYENTVDHAEVFSDWLWGVFKKEVGETKFLLRVGDAEVSGYSKKSFKVCYIFCKQILVILHCYLLSNLQCIMFVSDNILAKGFSIQVNQVIRT